MLEHYKSEVLKFYPDADIHKREAVKVYGQLEPVEPSRWAVSAQKALGAMLLGEGDTEEQAWQQAAVTVDRKHRGPGFVRQALFDESGEQRDPLPPEVEAALNGDRPVYLIEDDGGMVRVTRGPDGKLNFGSSL